MDVNLAVSPINFQQEAEVTRNGRFCKAISVAYMKLRCSKMSTDSKPKPISVGLLLLVAFTGTTTAADCTGNPCQNSGTCVDSSNSGSLPQQYGTLTAGYCCQCSGFSGLNCANSDPGSVCVVCSDDAVITGAIIQPPVCICGGELNLGESACSTSTRPENTKTCFPASAHALVRDSTGASTRVAMWSIKIGDKVLSLDEMDMTLKYSPVYMFGHADSDSPAAQAQNMYRGLTTGGQTSACGLVASPGHYVWRKRHYETNSGNGEVVSLAEMQDIVAGDLVLVSEETDGNNTIVHWNRVIETAEQITEPGLYNPQTITGNIVVDGVVASCYSNIMPAPLGHTLLWIMRQVYNIIPQEWNAYQQRYIANVIINVITRRG